MQRSTEKGVLSTRFLAFTLAVAFILGGAASFLQIAKDHRIVRGAPPPIGTASASPAAYKHTPSIGSIPLSIPSRPAPESASNRLPIYIDFGLGSEVKQGIAAAGANGDEWNLLSGSFEAGKFGLQLKNVDRSPSSVSVALLNLRGSSRVVGGSTLAHSDPMLRTFVASLRDGEAAQVLLSGIPPGRYDLFVYGKTASRNGDFEVFAGIRGYGRKQTSDAAESFRATHWEAGNQYVTFPIELENQREDLQIHIRPTGSPPRAIINGLQLVPR